MKIQMPDLSKYSNLGDKRLNDRFNQICQQLYSGLSLSIPQAMKERKSIKATYRFFNHEKVIPSKLISAHFESLELRKSDHSNSTILVPQDTTEVDLTSNRSRAKMGPMNYAKRKGLYLHSSLMVSSTGVPIGILKQDSLVRTPSQFGRAKARKYQPIEKKESYRWIEHFNALQELFSDQPQTEIISISDKEADIYELLISPRQKHIHFLINSKHNRLCTGTQMGMWQKVEQQKALGTISVKVTDPVKRTQRSISMKIRACDVEVELRHPKAYQKHLPTASFSIIEARQLDDHKNGKPLIWRLITSKAITNLMEAEKMVRFYARRWLIERFHYVLKSAAKIEELQLATLHRMQNAMAVYSITAVNLLRINYFARDAKQMDIYQAGISTEEHQALYLYAQKVLNKDLIFETSNPPTVGEFIQLIGRIGGFLPSKRQPFPGVKTLWRGLREFESALKMFYLLMPKNIH